MDTEAERRILARAEDLADTDELTGDVLRVLARARAVPIDQCACRGLVRAVKLLDLDGEHYESVARACRRGRRNGAEPYAAEEDMFDAINDLQGEVGELARAADRTKDDAGRARREAHGDRREGQRQLARARQTPVSDPCRGCHAAKERAIKAAEDKIVEAREREAICEDALEILGRLRLPAVGDAIALMAGDYESVYSGVLEHVREHADRDTNGLPEETSFISGEGADRARAGAR